MNDFCIFPKQCGAGVDCSVTPNDSLKPTAEQLVEWKEAGVLFEFLNAGEWSEPAKLDHIRQRKGRPTWYVSSLWGVYEDAQLESKAIRPYRALGHIQPHDGSIERPDHVPEDARVMVFTHGIWDETLGYIAHWAHVKYYIVLPEIKP